MQVDAVLLCAGFTHGETPRNQSTNQWSAEQVAVNLASLLIDSTYPLQHYYTMTFVSCPTNTHKWRQKQEGILHETRLHVYVREHALLP